MLSVIIPTLDAERALLPTLSMLVPGAASGAVRDVILADGGSRDATAEIADVAGCRMMQAAGPLGARLRQAAAGARSEWLLFVRPGTTFDPGWIAEVSRFIETAESSAEADVPAAVFRRSANSAAPRPMLAEALGLILAAFSRPQPQQALLIARRLYDKIGGHRADAADPESDLLRRLGRKRIAMLRTTATTVVR